MANTPITMSKLRSILRLYCTGTGVRTISAMTITSRNTVKKYIRIYNTLNLSYDELIKKDDAQLCELFSAPKEDSAGSLRHQQLEKLLPDICKKLKKRGVTSEQLYKEYIKEYPDGYSMTSFRVAIQRYIRLSHPMMRQQHKAGDKMFIDYTGDKLSLTLPDGSTRQVEVFVAILGCSQLTYVEAVESQKKEDLISACENAFLYYGGTPRAVVPDNLKAAVTKASRYEAVLNPEFAAFAEHYGVVVYPARGYKPRDKALVENAVKLTYKDIYTKLEGLECADLTSLNLAIRSALEMHNNALLTGRNYSRREYFQDVEREELGPLNPIRYEVKKQVMVTVNRYGHARLGEDMHYYSVPYTYMGKKVKLSYSADRVNIYYSNMLIASHKRSRVAHQFTTLSEHQPAGHRFISEWTPEKLIAQAAEIHPDVESYIKQVLVKKQYPDQAHKCCSGILAFARKVGIDRLIAACRLADSIGKYNYLIIEEILHKKLDQIEPDIQTEELPCHDNIRGKDYYQ